VHRDTRNLLIHLLAVPLFVIGHLLIIAAILGRPWFLHAAVLCIVVSLALQKFGHSLEQTQVPPFLGPRDFIRRIYAEQFFNYWRFLISGQ